MRRLRPGCGCYEHNREPRPAGGTGRRSGPGAVRIQAPAGGLFPPAARQGSGRRPRLAGAGSRNAAQSRPIRRPRLCSRSRSQARDCAHWRSPPICARSSQASLSPAWPAMPRARAVWEMSAPMIRAAGNGAPASGCRTSPCCSMPGPGAGGVGARDRGAVRNRLRAHRTPLDVRHAGRGAVRIRRRHFAAGSRLGAQTPGARPGPARVRQPRCLGEVLLGYPNEYGLYTPRPLLAPQRDPGGLLPRAEDAPEQADLGRNGSYLVLRQLQQDVQGFWRELDRQAEGNAGLRERLAAAMVGRKKDGEPLAAPSEESGTGGASTPQSKLNDFTYRTDPEGLRCPLGAHIRRTNPRNADLPPGGRGILSRLWRMLGFNAAALEQDLVASTRFHRLLRRGRTYGSGVAPARSVAGSSPGEIPGCISFAWRPTSSASSSSCKARG